MDLDSLPRRRFLSGVSAAGLTGLAGCSSELDGGKTSGNVDYPPTSVSDGLWVSKDKSAIPFEQTGLSGTGAVRTYENTRIQKIVKKRFLGQFTQPLAVGYAVKLQYSGIGATGVTADVIHDKIQPLILTRMKSRGIQDIGELTESSYSSDNRPDPSTKWNKGETYSEFVGRFHAPADNIPLHLDGYGNQRVELKEKSIPMRILYFVRDLTGAGTSGSAYIVGGAYPESNYKNSDTMVLREENNSSIKLRLKLNTGLNIPTIRSELVNKFINPLLEDGF